MRPLTADFRDRPAPEAAKPRRRVPKATKAVARPKARRRKPAPAWLRPLLRWGGLAILIAGFGGGTLWAWRSGELAAARDRAARLVAEANAALGFTVAEVLVDGRVRTSRTALIAALGIRRGDPVLGLDLDRRRAAVERLGWVERARVERRLPNTIYVAITERVPYARWQLDRRVVLIDPAGVAIANAVPDDLKGLPLVVGPGANRRARDLLEKLATAPALRARVVSANLIRGRRWDIGLAGGVTVRLPEVGLAAAWQRLARLASAERLLSRDLVAIDLRLPDRLIVRLAPGAQAVRRQPAKDT